MERNKHRKTLQDRIKGNGPCLGPHHHTFAGMMAIWGKAYPKRIGNGPQVGNRDKFR